MDMNSAQEKYLDKIRDGGTIKLSGAALAAMITEFYNLSHLDVIEEKAEAAYLKMLKEGGTALSMLRAQLRLRKYFKMMLANDSKAFENLTKRLVEKGLIRVEAYRAYKI